MSATTKFNVFSTSYLDQRIKIKAILTTAVSEVFFPFYTACFLIPKSKVASYINGTFNDNQFYKLKESEYATKCLGEFLDGVTTFYNQQHVNAELGFIIFDDQYSLDPMQPDTKTNYEDAPQKNRLETMNKVIGAIGRNACYVGVAETNVKRYSMMMDDFRQCDTQLQYLKCKVRNTLTGDGEITDLVTDFEAFGGTLMGIHQAETFSDTDEYKFKNRLDFVVGGVLLNTYQPSGENNVYKVGMALDGLVANVTTADITYNAESANLDTITRNYITYYQVRADDPTEILIGGGGVYYQGQAVPANMFLLANYISYLLKTNLFKSQEQNRSGVANATLYKKALSETMANITPYVGFLLDSATSKTYTQQQINQSVENKEVKLDNCITAVTMPTILFTSATFTLSVA